MVLATHKLLHHQLISKPIGIFRTFSKDLYFPHQTHSVQAFFGARSQLWQLVIVQGIVVGLGSECLLLPSVPILP